MKGQVPKICLTSLKKSSYFSLCLDKSTDNTDGNQLLIFIYITQEAFSSKEELFDMGVLHGITNWKDTYSAIRNLVGKIRGFGLCIAIVTDNASAMIGGKSGFVWLLKENNVTYRAIHCIIH